MSSHKRALIIGINKYLCYSSKYCVNDANDLSMTLQRIGFETHIAFDCNLREFGDHINQFLQLIQPNDVVLFYFAGHGKYNRYEYYLLPSDYIYNLRTDQYDYIIRNAINNLMKKIHKTI
ncbi:hypothetical protein I4U23_001325 [Adineta vaga]|nr:hypothetical protein I4U23_001325 [Adineta vaga]